jgi:serine protease
MEQNVSGARNSWRHFPIEVLPGMSQLSVTISGDSGDADLYLNFGVQSTLGTYVCHPWRNGNSESCDQSNPAAGTWYISLHGYNDYANVDIIAKWEP